jgi:hypothetical protein
VPSQAGEMTRAAVRDGRWAAAAVRTPDKAAARSGQRVLKVRVKTTALP